MLKNVTLLFMQFVFLQHVAANVIDRDASIEILEKLIREKEINISVSEAEDCNRNKCPQLMEVCPEGGTCLVNGDCTVSPCLCTIKIICEGDGSSANSKTSYLKSPSKQETRTKKHKSCLKDFPSIEKCIEWSDGKCDIAKEDKCNKEGACTFERTEEVCCFEITCQESTNKTNNVIGSDYLLNIGNQVPIIKNKKEYHTNEIVHPRKMKNRQKKKLAKNNDHTETDNFNEHTTEMDHSQYVHKENIMEKEEVEKFILDKFNTKEKDPSQSSYEESNASLLIEEKQKINNHNDAKESIKEDQLVENNSQQEAIELNDKDVYSDENNNDLNREHDSFSSYDYKKPIESPVDTLDDDSINQDNNDKELEEIPPNYSNNYQDVSIEYDTPSQYDIHDDSFYQDNNETSIEDTYPEYNSYDQTTNSIQENNDNGATTSGDRASLKLDDLTTEALPLDNDNSESATYRDISSTVIEELQTDYIFQENNDIKTTPTSEKELTTDTIYLDNDNSLTEPTSQKKKTSRTNEELKGTNDDYDALTELITNADIDEYMATEKENKKKTEFSDFTNNINGLERDFRYLSQNLDGSSKIKVEKKIESMQDSTDAETAYPGIETNAIEGGNDYSNYDDNIMPSLLNPNNVVTDSDMYSGADYANIDGSVSSATTEVLTTDYFIHENGDSNNAEAAYPDIETYGVEGNDYSNYDDNIMPSLLNPNKVVTDSDMYSGENIDERMSLVTTEVEKNNEKTKPGDVSSKRHLTYDSSQEDNKDVLSTTKTDFTDFRQINGLLRDVKYWSNYLVGSSKLQAEEDNKNMQDANSSDKESSVEDNSSFSKEISLDEYKELTKSPFQDNDDNVNLLEDNKMEDTSSETIEDLTTESNQQYNDANEATSLEDISSATVQNIAADSSYNVSNDVNLLENTKMEDKSSTAIEDQTTESIHQYNDASESTSLADISSATVQDIAADSSYNDNNVNLLKDTKKENKSSATTEDQTTEFYHQYNDASEATSLENISSATVENMATDLSYDDSSNILLEDNNMTNLSSARIDDQTTESNNLDYDKFAFEEGNDYFLDENVKPSLLSSKQKGDDETLSENLESPAMIDMDYIFYGQPDQKTIVEEGRCNEEEICQKVGANMRCPDNSQMCSVKKTCTDSKCTCHVSSICKSDYSGIEDDISSEDLKIYGATCLSIQKEDKDLCYGICPFIEQDSQYCNGEPPSMCNSELSCGAECKCWIRMKCDVNLNEEEHMPGLNRAVGREQVLGNEEYAVPDETSKDEEEYKTIPEYDNGVKIQKEAYGEKNADERISNTNSIEDVYNNPDAKEDIDIYEEQGQNEDNIEDNLESYEDQSDNTQLIEDNTKQVIEEANTEGQNEELEKSTKNSEAYSEEDQGSNNKQENYDKAKGHDEYEVEYKKEKTEEVEEEEEEVEYNTEHIETSQEDYATEDTEEEMEVKDNTRNTEAKQKEYSTEDAEAEYEVEDNHTTDQIKEEENNINGQEKFEETTEKSYAYGEDEYKDNNHDNFKDNGEEYEAAEHNGEEYGGDYFSEIKHAEPERKTFYQSHVFPKSVIRDLTSTPNGGVTSLDVENAEDCTDHQFCSQIAYFCESTKGDCKTAVSCHDNVCNCTIEVKCL